MAKCIEILFPPPPYGKYSELKIDEESIHYITPYKVAAIITKIIDRHYEEFKQPDTKVTVIDGTGGVGGDTIALATHFDNVVSIEMDKDRFYMLDSNIKTYKFKNVEQINGDSVKYTLDEENKYDILHFDPPWGGADYKMRDLLRLTFGGMSMEDYIIKVNKRKNSPKLISIKLPKNYDLKHLCDSLFENNINRIYLNTLKKMLLVIIILDS